MKKITLMILAMLAMAQTHAATSEAAVSTDSISTEVPPTDSDGSEKPSHWKADVNGFYMGMGVHHNWEAINNSFEVGLLNAVSVQYDSHHGQLLSLGVGLHHRSYSVKRPNMLERDNAGVVVVGTYPSADADQIKDRTSNLNVWTIQFPLMFQQTIYKKLSFHVAGILNWNTNARVDNHYEMNNTDHDIHYKGLKYNKVNFDLMGGLSLKGWGLYCRYSPGKVLKDGYGPEIKQTWSLGLTLAL